MQDALPATPGAWHRRIFQLTWPVLLANLTIPLVGVVDTAVMGHLEAPRYIGAVAVGSQIFSAMYWLFGFLRMATTGLVSQAYGNQDGGEAVRTAWRSALLGLGIGASIVALQWPVRAGMLWLFEAGEAVEQLAATYFMIRVWGAPWLLLQTVMLGVLFGLQRMRATLLISLLYNGVNIALDVLFVIGFGWGVEGVALATVIAEVLAAVASTLAVLHALRSLKWSPALPEHLWRKGVARLFDVSGNLVVRSFFVQLPFFMVTLLGASLGETTLAANAILMQLFMLMAFAVDGFAHTAESLAGYAYGARNRRGLRQVSLYATLWALGLALLIALLIGLFGAEFIAAMSESAEVRDAAAEYLPWLILCPLLGIWAFLGDGIFIGTTHVRELRNCMFVAAGVFLVAAYGLLDPLGNHGLWVSFSLFMAVRGVLLGLLYPRIEAGLTAPR